MSARPVGKAAGARPREAAALQLGVELLHELLVALHPEGLENKLKSLPSNAMFKNEENRSRRRSSTRACAKHQREDQALEPLLHQEEAEVFLSQKTSLMI